MTVASRDERFAKELALSLSGPNFRAYTQTDIMGVEVGGAVKMSLRSDRVSPTAWVSAPTPAWR